MLYVIYAITANRTSPAKILPNNLNENDSVLPISDISSRIPTIKSMGVFKLMYFFIYLNPRCLNPSKLVTTIDSNAREIVIERSVVGALNSWVKCSGFAILKS